MTLDLQVLARQTPAVPDRVLIFTVAAGVGFFPVSYTHLDVYKRQA